ncbi:glycosyl transferases group 1 family protein [Vibrio cholerae HC-46B1]|uniref:glycosyltransferase family 4 protein n=1 Tax=Vibrio cholerae TaxID=666 RepID=UPI00027348F7|nr:glycosyltransferase family 4 protein [Vibrio cholerae]EJH57611.1 glycosyl transferases group 1 family protein [Vibrio cholerae HC-43B1]EKL98975.1 glycosyl transferases group 1 family protein [Vibrio cholerae HC-46B1]EKM07029.1 glycosyl transferases group 1 family protein [Vibrio cholerae HC-44C1]TXX39816.1 glycosyltransferase family 4 protein [Vibrio cholerae]GHW59177.1 glycosyl transferase [Vibrio cholerae]
MQKRIIIHVNFSSGFGGGEVQTINLITGSLEYEHYVFAKNHSKFLKKSIEANIKCLSFFKIIKLALSNKYVIFHAHDGRGAHIAQFLSFLTGKKYIITRRVDKPLKGTLSSLAYQRAFAIVGISGKVLDNIKKLNINNKVIYDSYSSFPSSCEDEKRLSKLDGDFFVTQVGSLIKIKNVLATIEVAREIEKKNNRIHFIIVGDGPEYSDLLKKSHGLKNITFWGFTPNMTSIFEKTDLLIHPSLSEGLGSSILEAYQFNIPVITNNVGGIPEIVVNEKTGYIVPNADVSVMSEKIMYIFNRPDILSSMKGYISEYKENYSLEKMIKEYEILYAEAYHF